MYSRKQSQRCLMMSYSADTLHIGFEQNALTHGVKAPITVNFRSVPHLLIVAPSGAGKTHLEILILKQLSEKQGTLILADFKGVDFIHLDGCHNYYKHTAVADALAYVFDILQERMANPQPIYEPVYLVIDEWSGFLSLYPKKEQDIYKQQLASILMLGRGLRIFITLAIQRADASYLAGRDNFGNCIGLGALSKESINMVFSDFKDSIRPKGRGRGYLRTDGKPLHEIVVPRIRDRERAMEAIRKALM